MGALASEVATDDGRSTIVDALELYASGIDGSDYVERVAPLIRGHLPEIKALLDVGAGGGQLGHALTLSALATRWTAIEPSLTMQRRLRKLPVLPKILPCGWADARASHHGYDTVLAANMPAPLTDAISFLLLCREWTRRSIVWVVPAQNGPRGLCLAGLLPAEWHGEDETPGVDIVLRRLPPEDQPDTILTTPWFFRLTVPSIPGIARYLAGRLGWPEDDPRRPDLVAHLQTAAEPVPGGMRLTVPRASAILIWSKP